MVGLISAALLLSAPAVVVRGETCDPCGLSATYEETLGWQSGYRKRVITASGCPNHYSYCSGKDINGCGGNYGEGSETKADVLDLEFTIPAIPVIAKSTSDFECNMGAIGIALNGIQIYGGAVDRTDDDDPGCELLDVSSSRGEWMGFDFCSGHTGGANGFNPYHYHFPPSCLLDQAGKRERGDDHRSTTATSHSPQIGWSLDGFPVYGPRGANGTLMEHAENGCEGARCLDFCSGREEELPGVDDFKYRYYFTGTTSDLYSLPSDPKPDESDYPFSFRCYVGCEWSDLIGETNRCAKGTTGVTDAYAARKTTGYTDKYVSAEATAYWYDLNGDDAMAPLCADAPTAAPTSASWAPTTHESFKMCATTDEDEEANCAELGGVCYSTEAHCLEDGGEYKSKRCGDDCGCCVSRPSPLPVPAPTPAPSIPPTTSAPSENPYCTTATDSQETKCVEERGGECFASNVTCFDRGGLWRPNQCGSDCGCCVKMPSSRPTCAHGADGADDDDDDDAMATASTSGEFPRRLPSLAFFDRRFRVGVVVLVLGGLLLVGAAFVAGYATRQGAEGKRLEEKWAADVPARNDAVFSTELVAGLNFDDSRGPVQIETITAPMLDEPVLVSHRIEDPLDDDQPCTVSCADF